MHKDELLQLLQDREIRRNIREISREDEDTFSHEKPAIAGKNQSLSNAQSEKSITGKLASVLGVKRDKADKTEQTTGPHIDAISHESELQVLKTQLKQAIEDKNIAIQRAKDAEAQADSFQLDITDLQSRCNKVEGMAQTLRKRCETAENKVEPLQNTIQQLEASERTLKEKVTKLQNERASEKAKWDQERIVLQNQLTQRFARGWELFETYQTVDADIKQRLSGVFTKEDSFMSFICGGAQTGSLEALWDILYECVQKGKENDAEKLWDIFEYSLRLVNASKLQARYEVLPIQEGDRFDSDLHSEGPDSKAQGRIVDVYLRGFRNSYNGKVIRKSIVQVG